jgi:hypothetical protein
MRRPLKLMMTAMVLISAQALSAQEKSSPAVSDHDLQLLRKDLRSMKKQLIAVNIQLTEAEAEKFWPVYDQYAAETSKIYDARYAIIYEYADNIRNLSDAQAQNLTKRYADSDVTITNLRLKYLPIFAKVISGKKTALFFQVDRRLALMIDLQLASEIPLVQP